MEKVHNLPGAQIKQKENSPRMETTQPKYNLNYLYNDTCVYYIQRHCFSLFVQTSRTQH